MGPSLSRKRERDFLLAPSPALRERAGVRGEGARPLTARSAPPRSCRSPARASAASPCGRRPARRPAGARGKVPLGHRVHQRPRAHDAAQHVAFARDQRNPVQRLVHAGRSRAASGTGGRNGGRRAEGFPAIALDRRAAPRPTRSCCASALGPAALRQGEQRRPASSSRATTFAASIAAPVRAPVWAPERGRAHGGCRHFSPALPEELAQPAHPAPLAAPPQPPPRRFARRFPPHGSAPCLARLVAETVGRLASIHPHAAARACAAPASR